MSTPRVSIVVPSYNHERFLLDCLRSIASQDYPNMELVVIDDVSKDGSLDILERLRNQNDVRSAFQGRIRFEVNARNLGAHATINKGISLCTGDYIGILNSDDTYAEKRLSLMMSALSKSESRLAFSKVEFIDSAGAVIARPSPFVHRLRHRQSAIERFPSVGFSCLASNVAISTGNLIFERRLFEEVGSFSDLRYCHDWDFLLRSLLVTEPLYVAESGYNYRIHGTNSFRSLDAVAASESAVVYQTYFDRVTLNRHQNRKAPAPLSWPGVFGSFMDAYGLWPHWPGDPPDRDHRSGGQRALSA